MHPESWQTVKHLLICWWNEAGSIADLETLVSILKQGLPNTQLSLFTSASLASVFSSEDLSSVIIQEKTAFDTIIQTLRQACFDVSFIFTAPGQSPYSIAYLCYLAGITTRIGQSKEFGGRVLSTCITPLPDPISAIDYHLHLLRSLNLPIHSELQSKI